jgi:hypothetical protein
LGAQRGQGQTSNGLNKHRFCMAEDAVHGQHVLERLAERVRLDGACCLL